MKLRHVITGGTIFLSFFLALACGGTESNASASGVTTTVEGTVDFDSVDTALSKPRFSATTGGNVYLYNLATSPAELSANVQFSGNSFSANVAPGNYEIIAVRGSGDNEVRIRSYAPSVSSTSNSVAVDVDTTTASLYIDILTPGQYSTAPNVLTSVRSADNTLMAPVSQSSGNSEKNLALIFNYLKLQAKKMVGGNTHVAVTSVHTSSANVEEGIQTAGGSKLLAHIPTGNVVYLPFGTSGNPSAMDLSAFDSDKTVFEFESSVSGELIIVKERNGFSSSTITSIDAATGNVNVNNAQAYPTSDIDLAAYGRNVYVIGRSGADFLEKRDIDNLGVNLYGAPYSTLGAGETGSKNPHDLIFASESRALLTRYDSNLQWLVDPSAASSEAFLISEIDLSHYDTADSSPNIDDGVYVGGNYFLAAQRLDGYTASANAYLIVLDGNGVEIETGKAAAGDNLKGIELPIRNPQNMVYNADLHKIFVQGTGSPYSAPFSWTSGIVTIDPDTYEVTVLVDDDAGVNNTASDSQQDATYGGGIFDLEVASSTRGYMVVYRGWGSNDLRPFNPSTGAVGDVIMGFEGIGISDLAADSMGQLWISTWTGLEVLDTSDNTVTRSLQLNLTPDTLEVIRY